MRSDPCVTYFLIIVSETLLYDLLYVIIGLQSMQFGVLLAIVFVLGFKLR
jgi:hypothetical protein